MGGNAQSVKLHPPTHPLQLTSPGILATPGHHNANYNLCFSSGILATPDYHNASFIRCFSSREYRQLPITIMPAVTFSREYRQLPITIMPGKFHFPFWPLKSDCLTQPSETTLFRPIPKRCVSIFLQMCGSMVI